MKKEDCQTECCTEKMTCKPRHGCGGGQSNAIYGLGVVGALFYFLQNVHSFGDVMMGIGKAIFWPAVLMFKLLTDFKM